MYDRGRPAPTGKGMMCRRAGEVAENKAYIVHDLWRLEDWLKPFSDDDAIGLHVNRIGSLPWYPTMLISHAEFLHIKENHHGQSSAVT